MKLKCKGQDITYTIKFDPTQRNVEPASFHAEQKGTNCSGRPYKDLRDCKTVKTKATISLDPILKKHPDLQKAVLKHELDEICSWAQGDTAPHKHAREKEVGIPKGGATGFYKEIKRRSKAAGEM
uniref:Uncharacterized protein n=1 Tax=viral metagenome TaxID=1070528 RepID=A0A6M3ID33_9ZZZZ